MSAGRTRVLVLGATGMLGSEIARQFPSRFDVVAPAPRRGDRSIGGATRLAASLEARDRASLPAVLDEARADVVVNCVAVTPSSAEHADAEAMVAVNALFPHQLAAEARRRGLRVVHVSTDAVFSGARGGYREDDRTDPVDLYGRSKLAGEPEAPGWLTVRTSLFGRSPQGTGLVEWLMSRRGGVVEGYVDHVFSGVPAPVLAGWLGDLIPHPVDGVVHLGGPAISKHDLIVAISRALDLGIRVEPVEKGRVDRSLVSTRSGELPSRPPLTLDAMMDALGASVGPRPDVGADVV